METTRQLKISDFKAQCLGLLDKTGRMGTEYIITKNGKPIAKIVSFKKINKSSQGALQDLLTIHGDIVNTDFAGDWDVLK